MRVALANARVLLESGWVDDRVVLLRDDRIEDLVAPNDPRLASALTRDLDGNWLLPGFVDVQVNGGGGALLNADPSVETIRRIAAAHRRFGTTALLPTLISDDTRMIARAIDAVRDAIASGVPGVVGIHIEGPCLNEVRKGTHDAAKFRSLDDDDIALLSSLGNGVTVVTLAPEMTTPETIAALVARGVRVSAGHTNATHCQMLAAMDAGLSGVTHLFNAMSPLANREPGVVGAALSDPRSWCGVIADGHHVDPVVLRLALRCKRHDRFLLVTDAMPPVGSDQDHFMLQGRRIEVRDGRCVDANGVISGSALDMATAVRNAVDLLGLDPYEAVNMASLYPAQFLGLDAIGRIAPGTRADLVLADARFEVRATWIGGVEQAHVVDATSPA